MSLRSRTISEVKQDRTDSWDLRAQEPMLNSPLALDAAWQGRGWLFLAGEEPRVVGESWPRRTGALEDSAGKSPGGI